ncbi:glycogen debranching protein [Litoribacter ruber]|uniref:alpha-L-rhamnosidase-related protein n=1 Tax=Litoribacter ruber TaxID=702568 RepID=UPI001BDB4186|nr:glycogen debranching protein [Litoribacter ruber]MBT0809778.1 glycogen debranching protein [Litoribacter ruber]
MKTILFSFLLALAIFSVEAQQLADILRDVEGLPGREEYLASPFVTAGDRLYMVGYQDGTFPDLGWHVEGEMGGIWNHPIKLMDGFTVAVGLEDEFFCLDRADMFINYPFANKHVYKTTVPEIEIERIQFVPEGMQGAVIEFTLSNLSENPKQLSFEFTGHVDLRPVWLGEKAGMFDHPDLLRFDDERKLWTAQDEGNEWHVVFGGENPAQMHLRASPHCNYEPKGQGAAASLIYDLTLDGMETKTLTISIAGSYASLEEALGTYDDLLYNSQTYLEEKKQHYEQIALKSRITIPDKDLEKAFEWVKYNTEWLVRDVPEIGMGLGAGMPDYPWWFGVDNEYTLQGAIATGRKDLTYSTIDLLHKLSEEENGNGRIVHEVSTNGVVFNPGNINETPQFVSLIWEVYKWTGDRDFLEKYYPTIQNGLTWLMEENDEDGNLFPDGYGMMEIHGLESEMIDVATYTQAAFADAAKIAEELQDERQTIYYQGLADRIREKINEDFWVEEANSYADFIGTASEALHLIEAAIIRADTLDKPWAVEELKAMKSKISALPPDQKQGFVVFHNWVVNTPMEMGIADREKAIKALDKGARFVNPFGVFVTGIDRDDSSDLEDGAFAGSTVFSYTGAVMTLPTGVQAIAENNYGRPDQALDYLQRMTRSFGFALPGSIYEVSPDYGMMAQAWNLYSYAVPIVTQFFGIKPQAGQKKLIISTQMPSEWEEATIENVEIGNNAISLKFTRTTEGMELELLQQKEDWEIEFSFPEGQYETWTINGEEVTPEKTEKSENVNARGKRITASFH